MQKKRIIRQVWQNKATRQLLITLPFNSDIKKGDFIEVKKI